MVDRLFPYYFNKGLAEAGAKRLESAVENLIQALMLNTNSVDAWNLLGVCCYGQGKLGTAEFCWEKSLGIRESDNRASFCLDACRQESKVLQTGFAQVTKLVDQGKFKQAARFYDRSMSGCYEKTEMINKAGLLKYMAGDKQGAGRDWLRALELDQTNSRAIGYLSRLSPIQKRNASWLTNPFMAVKRLLK